MTESRRELPDPAAMHRDIQRLCDQLHGLVEAAAAQLDGPQEEVITLSVKQYERLLELAGQSPDLVGRAELTFDREEPDWRARREAFQEKVLDDLAAREDLDYDDFCSVLDAIEELDETEVPARVAPAMLRAWLRSGDLEDTRRWRDPDSWRGVREEDAQAVLDAAVDLLVQSRLALGSEGDALPFWIKKVAPLAYGNPRERLEWLSEHVAGPSNEGDLGEVGEVIREVVWRWYREVDDLAEQLPALRAIHDIATSGCEPSGEMIESLEGVWRTLVEAGPSPEDEAVVAAAVKAAIAEAPQGGASADELRWWVTAVAPTMYPDLADRLMWFAETVGRAAGDAPALPDDVVGAATEAVCEWLDALRDGPIGDVAMVVRTFRRTPMGACVEAAEVRACLERMEERIEA